MLRYILIAWMILTFLPDLKSQDYLVKMNGEHVQVVILEVRDSSIVYTLYEDTTGVIFELPKSSLDYISFGKIGKNNTLKGYHQWNGTPTMTVKLGISALAQNALEITAERMLTPSLSAELSYLHHFLADDTTNDFLQISGHGFELGVKYRPWRKPYLKVGRKARSLLSGAYFKGTLTYSKREEVESIEITGTKVFMGGVQFGHQIPIGNYFLLDFFGGVHGMTGDQSITSIRGGFTIPSRLEIMEGNYRGEGNFATSFGLRIGVAFGHFKWE